MKHPTTWYQDAFGRMKIDFQTRRKRKDNEVLAFVLGSNPRPVNYIRVDPQGVTVCATPGVNIYAAWQSGDRFERLHEALKWVKLPESTSPPLMCWDDYSAWEVTPSLQGGGSSEIV